MKSRQTELEVLKRENHFSTNPISKERKVKSAFFLTELLRDLTNYLSTNVNVEFRGIENLQGIQAPVILFVAPHGSHVDSNFLRRFIGRINSSLKKQFRLVAAREYWDKPKNRSLQKPFVQVIYQDRKNRKQMMSDSEMIAEYVEAGGSVAYYVDGTRRNNAATMEEREIKPGAVWTAINARKSNPNIIVLYLSGSKQMMKPGSTWVSHRPKKGEPKFSVLVSASRPYNINYMLIPYEKQYGKPFEELGRTQQKEIVHQIVATLKGFLVEEDKKQNPHLYPEQDFDY